MKSSKPVLPGFIYFLIFIAGPWPCLPYFEKFSHKGFKTYLILGSLVPFLLMGLLPYNWLLITLLIGLVNLVSAVVIIVTHPFNRQITPGQTGPRRLRKALALAMASLPFAVFLASMEQWLSDFLWSSYYPVNASVNSISEELGFVWLNFAILLFFSALKTSKEQDAWSLTALVKLILLVMGAHVLVNQLNYFLMLIPLWQVDELSLFPGWLNHGRQILFLFLCFISVPILIHHTHQLWKNEKHFFIPYLRGLLSIGLAILGLAVMTGLPISYALLMGQHYEKSGTPNRAIPWYSKALSWSGSDNLKSYLQFRVALLERKSGHLQESKEAFIRVLIKYYHDSRVLLEAHEFKDKLEKNNDSTLKRVVISGIEARTEYKSAYCVPNSLGLVLNYWGDRRGAKKIGAEITQLDKGSLITDEVFYSESRNFTSLVLPLCTFENIFKLIDEGIPVLAFIPGHVIAIFGYDQVLQTLVTYDVNTYDIWEDQRWNEFSKDWSHMYNTLGIVIPNSKLAAVKKVLGENVVAQNEAYLQYMLSKLADEDGDLKAKRLGRAAGHGFFFADWEYENLIGKRPLPIVPDSTISQFLTTHDVYESQILDYLQSLYRRGDYVKAIRFIENYRKENSLSTSIASLLAGCYNQLGQDEKTRDILLSSINLEDQETVTLEFLLEQKYVQEDPETARRISLKLLASEETIKGNTAALAYWTWRKNTPVDFRNIDEALAIMDAYLSKWNPYDKAVMKDLLETFHLKKFRSEDEFNQRNWEKKIRIFQNRLAARF